MRRLLLLALVAAFASALLAASAGASAVGPPGGTIYAFDTAYRTVATPATFPQNRGPVDVLYVFPDCPTCEAVSEAAPGSPGYDGGRWAVHMAHGITTQLTNAAAVEATATSIEDSGVRFVCPLIRAR